MREPEGWGLRPARGRVGTAVTKRNARSSEANWVFASGVELELDARVLGLDPVKFGVVARQALERVR